MNNITSFRQNNYQQPTFKANPAKKHATIAGLAARAVVGARKVDEFQTRVTEKIARKIVAPIMNNDKVGKLTDKTVNFKDMTDHMATTGSVVTTATYAVGTLTNKKMEKKPARTLALNQILVTVLSTIGALTINNSIANATKKMSYKFSDVNQLLPNKVLSKRVAGFKVAQKLLTFSLMYRYVAPVLVTPIASKIGKALNDNGNAKAPKKA